MIPRVDLQRFCSVASRIRCSFHHRYDTFVREGKKLRNFATEKVFPKAAGFLNYRSFSKPVGIHGKSADVADDAESEDFGASWLKRSKIWLRRLPAVMMLLSTVVGGILFLWAAVNGHFGRQLMSMLVPGVDSKAAEKVETVETMGVENAEKTESSAAGIPATPEKPAKESVIEKILLVTPSSVVTDQKTYQIAELPELARGFSALLR